MQPSRFLIAAFILTAAAMPASAQNVEEKAYPEIFQLMAERNKYKEDFINSILRSIRRNASDQKTLTEADIKKIEDAEQKRQRDSQFSRIIKYDIDMDTNVSKQEVEENIKQQLESQRNSSRPEYAGLYEEQLKKTAEREIEKLFKNDTNKDGKISLDEMRQPAPDSSTKRSPEHPDNIRGLLKSDTDKDGQLTVQELESHALQFFASIDKDGDGILSDTEKAPFSKKRDEERQARRMEEAGCNKLPDVKDTPIYAAMAYESHTHSTVALGGQDNSTQYMQVNIGADVPENTTLVLSSYESMIWDIKGDTKRIGKAIIYGRGQEEAIHAGVIGLKPDQTTFVNRNRCIQSRGDENKDNPDIITNALSKKPTQFAYVYGAETIFISANGITNAPGKGENTDQYDEQEWQKLIRFSPGGIKEVNIKDVYSLASKENYDVMPQEAGLAQLVKSGALVVEPGGYKIVKPIKRYPSNLTGAHSVTFILGKDIPVPAGSAGHSCVKRESGETVGNSPICGHH